MEVHMLELMGAAMLAVVLLCLALWALIALARGVWFCAGLVVYAGIWFFAPRTWREMHR